MQNGKDEKDVRFEAAIQGLIQQRDAYANQVVQLQMDNATLQARLNESEATQPLPTKGENSAKEKAAK